MDELDRIGRFETVKLLGRGGMGVVYLARDPVIDRPVAVKLLGEGFDAAARERFAREARAVGRLDHENIVRIFDVGEHHGRPFIAMEFVPGHTLGALMRRAPRLPQVELLSLVEDACRGLAFAHRSGVVHLDVKPENLIRRDDGRLKILDFGIARVIAADETQTRHVLGTLRYMSPEQLTGGLVDHRSDIFGLGCVIFEVLAGQPAFGDTWPEVLARLNGAATPRLSDLVPVVHPGLERLTARAMAFNPAERYDDLETLRQELAIARREIGGETALPPPATAVSVRVPEAPASSPAPVGMPAARAPRRTARWFGAAVAAALVVALGVSLWPRRSASPTEPAPAPAVPASATAPLDAPNAATADASRPSPNADVRGHLPTPTSRGHLPMPARRRASPAPLHRRCGKRWPSAITRRRWRCCRAVSPTSARSSSQSSPAVSRPLPATRAGPPTSGASRRVPRPTTARRWRRRHRPAGSWPAASRSRRSPRSWTRPKGLPARPRRPRPGAA